MGALPIYGNLRYTGHVSGPNFGLVENCKRSYLMVLVITSSGYPFFNKIFFIKSSSSTSFSLEQVIKALWTKGFIKLILRLEGQNESHLMYDPVNVGLR